MEVYIALKDDKSACFLFQHVKKNEVHQQYKYYRDLLSTLMKKSKQNYYERFFKNKLNKNKKTQKYMERHKELDSCQTFICIKYTGAVVTNP